MKRLFSYHYKAMELREAGRTYAEIAAEIGKHERTVLNWFNGDDCELFQQEYEKFRADMINNIVTEGKETLKKSVEDAVSALTEIVNFADNPHARLRAAEDILDRAGIEAGSKVKQDVKQQITDGEIKVRFFSDREGN